MTVDAAYRTSATQEVWSLDDGTVNERIVNYVAAAGALFAFIADGGVPQIGAFGLGDGNPGATYKTATAWAANDVAFSRDGRTAVTDASATLPTVTSLKIGRNVINAAYVNSHIKRLAYYASRKTNAELQVLST
jgi:hypothetical protein